MEQNSSCYSTRYRINTIQEEYHFRGRLLHFNMCCFFFHCFHLSFEKVDVKTQSMSVFYSPFACFQYKKLVLHWICFTETFTNRRSSWTCRGQWSLKNYCRRASKLIVTVTRGKMYHGWRRCSINAQSLSLKSSLINSF